MTGMSMTRILFIVLPFPLLFVPIAAQDHSHRLPQPMAPGAAMPVGPPILENISKLPNTVEVTLTASPTQVSLVPNTTTAAYA
jgi:hypothetical protein